jgi:hypothetical protein
MRIALSFSFLLALFAGIAASQPISVGVKVGVPFGDPYSLPGREFVIDKQQWTIGPTIEFNLPLRLAIGIDAMYQPLSARGGTSIEGAPFTATGSASRWDVPIYLKYRLGDWPVVRPFVAGGGVVGVAWGTLESRCDGPLCGLATVVRRDLTEVGAGFVVGGGVEFKLGPLKIAPEIRYTNWQSGILASQRLNQTSILAGFRF